MMNQQYFDAQSFSPEDLRVSQRTQRRHQHATNPSTSLQRSPHQHQHQLQQRNNEPMSMIGGDSLDDIIMQNSNEIQRRQSFSQPYSPNHERRASMLEFGSGDGSLDTFQFGTPTTSTAGHLRRLSAEEMDIGMDYNDMAGMPMPNMGYPTSMHGHPLSIDTSGQYGTMMPLMGYGPYDGHAQEQQDMSLFSPASFTNFPVGMDGTMGNDFMLPRDNGPAARSKPAADEDKDMPLSAHSLGISEKNMVASPVHMGMGSNIVDYQSSLSAPSVRSRDSDNPGPGQRSPGHDVSTVVKPEPPKPGQYGDSIYSKSGFDMLGALMRVATRKNPEINIGMVDMSCAFVVCDLREPDVPIIYVSEIFERLTGYSKHEVLGRNCRFLQSPNGKIQAGSNRKDTDNDRIHYLKRQVDSRKEAQTSVINYRKGGQPFMNLLTMIPIKWDEADEEPCYIIGFQVDIVVKPDSIMGGIAEGGSYAVNYQQGTLPRYVWQPPTQNQNSDRGQTVSRDDVSAVLNAFESGADGDFTKRMWDKVLLENADDVVHVLSLKGLFLYLSPSCKKVLEYDSAELVGTALSSVCHPSDIVPVTRELKDTTAGLAVNVVFRIRRKNSGYTWFESHGSLVVEPGKGRKCIIMVGRERPVYALLRHDIISAGGFAENELWTKLSTSGMFLFVSSNVRQLLDRQPDELVGTSIQALMRAESKIDFGRHLEKARTGKQITYKHEVMNKRGLVLAAQTTLYPGDAAEGTKPTFFVAQTRLLRAGKPSGNTSKSSISTTVKKREESVSFQMSNMSPLNASPDSHRSRSSTSHGHTTAAGGLGLPIGNQDLTLASEDNVFDELKTTRCTSWQFELRQMEKSNRMLAEELSTLLANKKKRKRRKGAGHLQRDCANCHTKNTPEWRRGPSGNRDLCNSCGLRYAKQAGRMSPRTSTKGDASVRSSVNASPLHNEIAQDDVAPKSFTQGATPKTMFSENATYKKRVPSGSGTPLFLQSQGFRDGDMGITGLEEGEEGAGQAMPRAMERVAVGVD